jgi:predicted amidohydrolase
LIFLKTLKVAIVQMRVSKSKIKNLETASGYIKKASLEKADMVVLPEMFCCPYETSCFPLYAEEEGESYSTLSSLAKENKLYLIAGSVPERDTEGKIYNTSYVFDRQGNLIGKHRKIHLFDIQIEGGQHFKESDTLSSGNNLTVFETEFGRIGLLICYDFRFPELSRLMVEEGAKAIIVPGAFNMTTGPAHWEILFRSRALDNQLFPIGAAPARDTNSNYISYGNSIVVSPWGDILARMDEKEGLLITELDLSYVNKIRTELPLLKHRRLDIYSLTLNNKAAAQQTNS